MTREEMMEALAENEAMLASGLDKAIIGTTEGMRFVAVYDYDKCVRILMSDGMDYSEALEWMEYNVVSAYVGEGTPVFISLAEK